ncbi:MAG TPA: hypothetical protein VGB46_03820 [Flavisolibacter sp.]|jgi:hypothetical protein
MRLIKLALISFIALALLVTIFSLFIPANVRISRAVSIRAHKDSVLELIKNQERWPEWNPAFAPNREHQQISSRFTGFSDSSVTAVWQQGNRQSIPTGWRVYYIPEIDSLTLHWYMDFHQPWYPWKKFESMFFDKAYGSMMEEGLGRLKKIVQGEAVSR